MKLIIVAAGVLNQTPLGWKRNRENIIQTIKAARQQKVSLLCLPELSICGYNCEDALYSPGVHKTSEEILLTLLPETKGIATCFGLPVMYAGGVFNTVAMVADGKILGFVAKQHLAGDGIHYEPRWFKPWPEGVDGVHEIEGVSYPIGDLLFDVGGVRVGFEICEDAWVGARPGAKHAARGADVIMNPSASHFAFDKHAVRRRFVIEGSRAFNVTYIYSNLVGNEAGRAIYDGDSIIASNGSLLATGQRLSFKHAQLTMQQVDIDSTRMSRARTGSFEPDVDGDESDIVSVDFDFPKVDLVEPNNTDQPWESSEQIKHEEFTGSVGLGLMDYMTKSRSRGFVVSLSGGADSAATAALVSLALKLAVQDLGMEGLLQRLNYLFSDKPPADVAGLTKVILTTVYQATCNSSDTTRNAARDVAKGLNSRHIELDVDPLVESYKKIVGEGLGIDLNWQDNDLALQNIQARTRAPSVWMIANIENALLLTTSNRSESAVGYATMDGDTCGGLAPLGGIDKAYLLSWLKWLEAEGPTGIGKVPELASVNKQQPTAELRPCHDGEAAQTDEADLMPYDVLDYIERLSIRDKKMPLEILEYLQTRYPDVTLKKLGDWITKFFRLWCRNQWKRERYAPSFHLDDESLDPKTWCRFPILSGGYDYELEKLWKHIKSIDKA